MRREFGVGRCVLILTSRPEYVSKEIKAQMDGHIIIEGFSLKNVVRCTQLFLESKQRTEELLSQALRAGIFNPYVPCLDSILRVPIVLLMTCVIFDEQNALPPTETEIIGSVFRMLMDRSTLKTLGCKSSEIPNIEELLYTLGRFSWDAFQKDVGQLLLSKVSESQAQTRG